MWDVVSVSLQAHSSDDNKPYFFWEVIEDNIFNAKVIDVQGQAFSRPKPEIFLSLRCPSGFRTILEDSIPALLRALLYQSWSFTWQLCVYSHNAIHG